MTPEEIKKIAEEYRKENDYHQDVANDVVELLQWLTERFYLVEKGKVEDVLKYPQRYRENIPGTLPIQVMGVRKVLHDLFGPDIRKEEEE